MLTSALYKTMFMFWIICGVIATIYGFLWNYFKRTVWCRSQTCLVGKTAIVTGANTGIGYQTALDFAKRGAKVILACRNEEKAENAKRRIIEETGNSNIVVKIVNLASFDSVRAFAKDVKATEDHLEILVNNAGVGGLVDKKSQDGLALTLQVNYLSSFLLTHLLLDLLKKSAPSRIINVSSLAAQCAKLDLEEINRCIDAFTDYANSKLCNILFTIELAQKLKGTNVTSYSLHPGAVETEIFRHAIGFTKWMIDTLKGTFFKTSEEGAQTTIYTSVTKGIEEFSGDHFDNCERTETYKNAQVPGLSTKLWQKSEIFVELKPEEKI